MKNYILCCFVLFFVSVSSFAKDDEIIVTGTRAIIESSIDPEKTNSWSERVDEDCSFAGTHKYYKLKEAENDAARAFYEGVYYFYYVGSGIGAIFAGPENFFTKTSCENVNIGEKILWVGGDSLICKDHIKVGEKAFNYAKKFNIKMINFLTENGACK